MRAELYWLTDAPHGRLAIAPRPRAGDWLTDELTSWRTAGVNVVVSLLGDDEVVELDLTDEPLICKEVGLKHISYPIVDRGVPMSVRNFLAFINRLHDYLCDDRGVVVHCRMGIGRSSVVAACLLAKSGFSTGEAFASISRDRGVNVPDTHDQVEWAQSIVARFLATEDKKIHELVGALSNAFWRRTKQPGVSTVSDLLANDTCGHIPKSDEEKEIWRELTAPHNFQLLRRYIEGTEVNDYMKRTHKKLLADAEQRQAESGFK